MMVDRHTVPIDNINVNRIDVNLCNHSVLLLISSDSSGST
jgi:hypothetical protein